MASILCRPQCVKAELELPLAPPTAYLDPTEIISVVVYDAEDVYF